MDYEKKYKEALERAKKLQETCDSTAVVGWCEYIFPELKESEDKKISREITEFILTHRIDTPNDIEDTDSWIHWLEKQGDQKASYTTIAEIPFGAKDSELQEVSYHIPEGFHAEIEGDKVTIKQGKQKSLTIDIKSMVDSYEQRLIKNGGVSNSPLVNMCVEAFRHGVENTLDELHLKQILANSCETCKDEPFDYENANIHQKDYAPKADMPRYSIGDVLCDKSCTMLNKESQSNFEITDIRNGMYICDKCSFPISQQDEYELVAKRIEQKSAWSEEDDMMIEETLYFLREYQQSNRCKDENGMQNSVTCEHWLKSLKERIKQ